VTLRRNARGPATLIAGRGRPSTPVRSFARFRAGRRWMDWKRPRQPSARRRHQRRSGLTPEDEDHSGAGYVAREESAGHQVRRRFGGPSHSQARLGALRVRNVGGWGRYLRCWRASVVCWWWRCLMWSQHVAMHPECGTSRLARRLLTKNRVAIWLKGGAEHEGSSIR
jgi:hypothetical protein